MSLEQYVREAASILAPAVKEAEDRASRDVFGTIALDSSGNPTVMLDGAEAYTPCTAMVSVHHGDRVMAHVVNHRLVVFANITAPVTDDEKALVAIDRADAATEAADAAGKAAASAQEDATAAKADAATAKASAASAVSDAQAAKSAATQAQTDASSAAQSAQSAQADAQAASTSAQQAQADASSASTSAGQAAASASQAAESASQAQADATTASNAATQAQGSASQAAESATSAQQQAQAAKAAADGAVSDAAEAKTAAGEARTAATNAQEDASKANTAANAALIQASIVEDVAGTLQWIKEHGQYVATTDTTVQDGTVYFQYNSSTGDYEPIVEPTGNPKVQGWYVLDITDAQSDFIMSHLAVTGRGLWVLPNGIGSQTTPGSGESQADSDARQGSGYKMLLSNDGTYIYDSQGNQVMLYGENITPSVNRPFYIGDPDSTSYIVFIPATGSSPASIRIGGDVSIGGSKTLSEVLSEVQKASADAATAIDSATLTITSTNGNLFKNGAESTVLQVAVFPNGGDRLDTIEQVRARFGSGAYIEWKWKHENGDWGTLPSNDPHLSQGGMWLTVTPEDVASKTSFSASLVTP